MERSCFRSVEKGWRQRGSNSCVVCKKAKVKCDEQRPCSRCKRLKRESKCVYEDLWQFRTAELEHVGEAKQLKESEHEANDESSEESIEGMEREFDDLYELDEDWSSRTPQEREQNVERPLDFYIRSVSFDKPSQLREHMISMGWPDRVLSRHWEFGFSSKEMMNIFVSLPPHLQQVTRRALQAIEIIVADKMQKQAQALQEKPLLMESETVTEAALELEQTIYRQQSFGVIKQHAHPDTGKRAHVYVSDAMCKFLGLHPEEALARIVNREMPLIATEFAFLCYMLFGAWSFASRPGHPYSLVGCLRYMGEHGEPGGGLMVRLDQKQEFDFRGRVRAVKSYWTPVREGSQECSSMWGDGQGGSGKWEIGLKKPYRRKRIDIKRRAGRHSHRNVQQAFERRKRLRHVEKQLRGGHVCGEGEKLASCWRLTVRSQGETILGMQKSKQGMQRLEALARDVDRIYQPFYEQAERLLQEKMRGLGMKG
eukprot:766973-Hanusia_phi.AAC.3